MSAKKNIANSFFSDSLNIFVVRALNTLAGLVAIIYFSYTLPKSVYGEFQQFVIYLSVSAAIAGLGFALLILTYRPQQLKALISTISRKKYVYYFIFVFAIAISFALLCLQFAQQTFADFAALCLFFIFYIIGQLYESILTVFKKYKVLAIGNLLYSLGYIGCCVGIVKHEGIIGQLAAFLLPLIFVKSLFYYLVTKRNLNRTRQDEKPLEISSVKSLWMQLAIYDLTAILFVWIDKFILSFIIGKAAFASYSNATMNIPFIGVIISAVGGAALMQFHQAKEQSEKMKVLNNTGKLLSCIAFPLFFFLLFFRNEFIEVAFSAKYLDIVPIFTASIMILPARAYNHTALLQHFHKGKILNIGAVLDLAIALGLMWPFYKFWGLPGIALSFVISTYLQSLFYLLYASKLLSMSPWKLIPASNWLIKSFIFGSIIYLVHFTLLYLENTKLILCAGALAAGMCSLLFLALENKKIKAG